MGVALALIQSTKSIAGHAWLVDTYQNYKEQLGDLQATISKMPKRRPAEATMSVGLDAYKKHKRNLLSLNHHIYKNHNNFGPTTNPLFSPTSNSKFNLATKPSLNPTSNPTFIPKANPTSNPEPNGRGDVEINNKEVNKNNK